MLFLKYSQLRPHEYTTKTYVPKMMFPIHHLRTYVRFSCGNYQLNKFSYTNWNPNVFFSSKYSLYKYLVMIILLSFTHMFFSPFHLKPENYINSPVIFRNESVFFLQKLPNSKYCKSQFYGQFLHIIMKNLMIYVVFYSM